MYSTYARFYDRTQTGALAKSYLHLLRRHNRSARSLLEIACGTGTNLALLSRHFEVAGLDISEAMLRYARKKLPNVRFYRHSMSSFSLGRRFDAIICPYDSINHLLRFPDWVNTFAAARRHLNKNGAFIFDINTEFKLQQLAQAPPSVRQFDEDFMLMKVSASRKGVTDWSVKIFERERQNVYRLHQDVIREASFSRSRITGALRRYFRSIRVFDARRLSRPRKDSGRLFFACKRGS